jgi:hypothetical protein
VALADSEKLIVDLSLKGNFDSKLRGSTKALQGFEARLSKTEGRAFRAGQQIGTGIRNGLTLGAVGVGILATQVAAGLRSLVELEQQTAQTNAVIKSTGGIAGVTATEVGRLAEKYESLNATVGDETIREGQNLLLTYTNIRKEAFEPALAAALDMNTALGKGPEGLTSTVRILGKALNDPTKGLSALTRVGITFDKEQTKRIKQLQEEGDLYGAQAVILEELNERFGGSFLAQGDTTAGKVAKFTDSIEDLQRALAEALLPTIGNVADELSAFLQDPAVMKSVRELGEDIAGLFSKENLRTGARVLGDFLQAAKDAAPAIGEAARVAGSVIGTAVKLFQSLPEPIQKLAVAGLAVNKLTGGLVTNVAGGLISAVLKQLVSGVVNVNGAVVNVNGAGLPGAGVPGGAPKTGMGLAGKVASLSIIAGGVVLTAESIQGFADENQTFKDKGLNQEEIAAMRYYTASTADQSTMAKRLGYIPDKADYASAQAKLDAGLADLKTMATRTKDDTVAATKRVETQQIETQRETTRGFGLLDQTARVTTALQTGATAAAALSTVMATRTGSSSIVGAIYASRPIITTNVHVNATTVQKTVTVKERYGTSGGSRDQNSNGSGTFGNGGR